MGVHALRRSRYAPVPLHGLCVCARPRVFVRVSMGCVHAVAAAVRAPLGYSWAKTTTVFLHQYYYPAISSSLQRWPSFSRARLLKGGVVGDGHPRTFSEALCMVVGGEEILLSNALPYRLLLDQGQSVCVGEGCACCIMHDRSRMTPDPRNPTVSGRSMSSFHRSGRHRLHQARSAGRVA